MDGSLESCGLVTAMCSMSGFSGYLEATVVPVVPKGGWRVTCAISQTRHSARPSGVFRVSPRASWFLIEESPVWRIFHECSAGSGRREQRRVC